MFSAIMPLNSLVSVTNTFDMHFERNTHATLLVEANGLNGICKNLKIMIFSWLQHIIETLELEFDGA